ncbi:MAG TPA: replicative DNA helicase [Micropepsaceae bacterium]|nr:replicative DNA helicase [Micropepsaceae bacterium]
MAIAQLQDARAIRADDTPTMRQPPHNIEIEQALLGALLINNENFTRLGDTIKPEHFFARLHGRIYEAASELYRRGGSANPLTLKMQFENDPDLKEVGGAAYLRQLAEDCPSVNNVPEFARTITNLAIRRQLIHVGEDIVNEAYDAPIHVTPQEQVEDAERALYAIATKERFGGGFKSFRQSVTTALQAAEAAHKRRTHIVGVTTGFTKLDNKLGGLQRSDLIILAGRPGMGKTALATNIAVNAARARMNDPNDGGAVAFFSLEMSAEQLAGRVMAQFAQIPVYKIRQGQIPNEKFGELVDAVTMLEEMPLYIDDSAGLSVAQVAARARRMKRDKATGLDMIVIDYLQLLEGSGGKRYDNRVQEVTDITKSLKALAKELNVPVVALSQLNRGVDARDDKRPNLSDLRESGSIEQDADVVMFVYREEYYLQTKAPSDDPKELAKWQEKMERVHGTGEVLIEKHRHGPGGTVKLAFQAELTRFDNLVEDKDRPESYS